MNVYIKNEQDLKLLDNKIDSYEASNHFPPYIICSEETKKMLKEYDKHVLPDDFICPDCYYISMILINNALPFGEIEIR